MSRFTHRVLRLCAPVGAFTVAVTAVLASTAGAAPQPVGLGTASSFAVLAGAGITNTGATTITGDVGTFPTASETGFGTVVLTGADHAGDGVTQGAKTDLVTAYNDAAGRLPETAVAVELGGNTFPPGVYTGGTLGLTGTVTLDFQNDPDAQFVFKSAATLITEVGSVVNMINGGDPCRVVWQVGSSATFKSGTQFVGDVLASASISAQSGATFLGRLLARDGAVTLINNTIDRGTCAAVAPAIPGGGGGGGGGTTSTTLPGTTSTTTPVTTTTSPSATTTTAPAAPTTSVTSLTPTITSQSSAMPTPGARVGAPAGNTPTTTAGSSTTELPRTGSNIGGLAAFGGTLFLLGLAGSAYERRSARRVD